MVDVRMADDHGIQLRRLERERIGVARFGFGAALDQAAVQQQAMSRGFDFMQRPGHFAGRTVEMDAHVRFLIQLAERYHAPRRRFFAKWVRRAWHRA